MYLYIQTHNFFEACCNFLLFRTLKLCEETYLICYKFKNLINWPLLLDDYYVFEEIFSNI